MMMHASQSAFSREQARQIVDEHLRRGERDPALIACNAANLLFGSRRCAVFPPPMGAPLPVRLGWDDLIAYIDERFSEGDLVPGDPQPRGPGVSWGLVSAAAGSLDLERYPWEAPVLHDGGMAVPGTCWVARRGDSDATLVREYVYCSLALAGADVGLAHDDSKVGRRLRREARDVILAASFNDQRVTSSSATLAGGRDPGQNGEGDQGIMHVLGKSGRGLVWKDRHYDDLARLARGLPAKRGVDLRGEPVGSGRCPMMLYLPAVNLAALRSQVPTMTTEGIVRANGKSTLEAPAEVDRIGVDRSGVEVPT